MEHPITAHRGPRSPRRRRSDPGGDGVATPKTDPFRPLRGEPPLDSTTLEEAGVWIGVYSEMSLFWRRTVAQFGLCLQDVTSERARQELRDVDSALLGARRDRAQRRLHLWEQRARELASADQPDDAVVHPPSPVPATASRQRDADACIRAERRRHPGPTTSFASLRPAGHGRPLWTGWGGVCPPPRPAVPGALPPGASSPHSGRPG